ncbi:pro-sigmaK processing inhibitor BofA family protein [Serpentinicella sp. ANB-PHB4]|uniref:pro-sigmaK processing inhibitor BofA family protein n=1 Tax=Serpentinicella sp. ANB-PHB4 TaxID=3074076 RepID=UPI00285B4CCF|nr:pro-sigmaK processing inhibitor BofA family protein [Serpentinicella sp. ANB-PHB4]MDR5658884.1 pro-sigmaK processing inhibitor BofA family protein [Serpentinicella sp. ANB-PHB4]
MGEELTVIAAYAVGIILIYAFGSLLLWPIKKIIKLIWNGIMGGILLLIFNFFGGYFDIGLTINPLTAIIAGVLGVPGVILLIIFNYMI